MREWFNRNRARLRTWLEAIRSSYWFIPSVMALGAALLAMLAVSVDGALVGHPEFAGVFGKTQPQGARQLLSTIAGSMITVAGVAFSITIAAVAYVSQQFGPRIISQFMRDRGNQFTLGTFTATFLYCLLVLRTIESGPLPGDNFVPHVGIVIAILLAVASVGVLIFFTHHVPRSIHVANVVADFGRELLDRLEDVFPTRAGYSPPEGEESPALRVDSRIVAEAAGYVQHFDEDVVLGAARDADVVVRVRFRPGDFVHKGDVIALVDGQPETDDLHELVRGAFVLGKQRTVSQDPRFLVQELVEIAARALSTAFNDPFTAINCLDWLGSALLQLADRDAPSGRRYDDVGDLRVVWRPFRHEEFIDQVFDGLRPYFGGDPSAARHMMKVLAELSLHEPARVAYGAKLAEHVSALETECEAALRNPRDVEAVKRRGRGVVRILHSPESALELDEDWFDGSA